MVEPAILVLTPRCLQEESHKPVSNSSTVTGERNHTCWGLRSWGHLGHLPKSGVPLPWVGTNRISFGLNCKVISETGILRCGETEKSPKVSLLPCSSPPTTVFIDIQILHTLASSICWRYFFLSREVSSCSNLSYFPAWGVCVCACVLGEECSGNDFTCPSKSCGSREVLGRPGFASSGTDARSRILVRGQFRSALK